MNRREFMGWVGAGTIAISLPMAIVACSPKTTETKVSDAMPRSDGFQVVGTVSELDKTGELLNEKLAVGKALVIRDPANMSQVVAVNPTCTHAGCSVVWQKDQSAFVCPCHDSKFAGNGKVLQGPADQPLLTYLARVEGDSILVKVS